MLTKENTMGDKPARRLPASLALRLSDCGVRFLLAAVLAGAELLGGHSLFALALVGVSGPGVEGIAALLGAALGYLSFWGLAEGLRYVAASMMVYAIALALGEFQIYHKTWFMPAVAAALNGLVGFVYQSASGWDAGARVGFVTEVILTAGAVYLYRLAFDVWEKRRGQEGLSVPQTAGVLLLAVTVAMTLARVEAAGHSLGRVLCASAALLCAWKGGVGMGAAAGVTAGLAMDLSAGTPPCYTLIYAFPGLFSGLFAKQNRMLCAGAFLLSGAAAVFWTWPGAAPLSALRELAVGTAVFLLLPDKLLRRFASLAEQEAPAGEEPRARRLAASQLGKTASAFRAVSASLRSAFRREAPLNDGDAARIFDRAADRVCVKCRQRERCWQTEYQATRTALSDALTPMLDRGEGRAEDFPPHFARRCVRLDSFLLAANWELAALLQRRRYDSRVRESRAAVCAQYGEKAAVLDRAAVELAKEPNLDVRRQRLVKRHMASLGLEGRCAVYSDQYGHLRVEVDGPGAEALSAPEKLAVLSSVVGCPLRAAEGDKDAARLCQREPLMVMAGGAAADRDGTPVSGDAGLWFKDDAGVLSFLLCDGMGSGAAARTDSECALSLLEKFLRAGLPAEEALKTVGEALALRGEAEGGFTTIDLLRLDLFTGKGAVYKLGAAPTYLRRGAQVERLAGDALPAGLGGDGTDVFPLELAAGDCVLLITDGVVSGKDDLWLRAMLAEFDGLSPQELAARVLAESGKRSGGGDDRTVIALKVDVRQ